MFEDDGSHAFSLYIVADRFSEQVRHILVRLAGQFLEFFPGVRVDF
jgi:hypothetical protein